MAGAIVVGKMSGIGWFGGVATAFVAPGVGLALVAAMVPGIVIGNLGLWLEHRLEPENRLEHHFAKLDQFIKARAQV